MEHAVRAELSDGGGMVPGELEDAGHVPIIQAIMQVCKDKIKWYNIIMQAPGENKLSPLFLPNAEYISMNSLYYYIKWTRKCHTLLLDRFEFISENWCNFVINNCDCSNIKVLKFLFDVSFSFSDDMEDDPKLLEKYKLVLQKLALKFTNLKQFSMFFLEGCDLGVLTFWQLLEPIIKANNTSVELETSSILSSTNLNKMIDIIDKSDLTIDKIKVAISERFRTNNSKVQSIGKLICNPSLKHLILVDGLHMTKSEGLSYMINYISNTYLSNMNTAFKLLNIIEIEGNAKVDVIKDLLKMKIITDKRIFVYIKHLQNHYRGNANDFFGPFFPSFGKLCQSIYELLINKQIPISINYQMTFRDVEDQADFIQKCNLLFLSHFEEKKLLEEYKQPQCDEMICTPLTKPQASLDLQFQPKNTFRFTLKVSNCLKKE